MDLPQRIEELRVIYSAMPDKLIIAELVDSQQRQQEQLARQMAISQLLGERAVRET